MHITLAKIGDHSTIRFAAEELEKYLKKIDSALFIEKRCYPAYDKAIKNALWIGIDGSVAAGERDEIRIDVRNGCGILTGSSERAVLIAGYRLLQGLGCRFLHPGREGEIIPERALQKEELTLHLQEQAAYRHRSVCIEGAVSYEHVYNMIDWLPKVGMNGYFCQFHTPSIFFKRFYNDAGHIGFETSPVNDEDVDHLWMSLEEEVIKRSLDYHATGHGWTCEPFGIHATGWDLYEEELPEEIRECLAMVDGRRELWGKVALNTNLCYSRKDIRDKMTDAIVAYSQKHPAVHFLHFWLADGKNNHCECEECRKMRPSDYYVRMLNELDEKLVKAGLDTKIVCLIYLDLLWEPICERVKNPDRFVLMFAPITRTYSTALADGALSEGAELAPYERNRLVMPKSVGENLARLSRWQKEQLNGDSFDFDYHLMWDHYIDPGYYACAKVLHRDMVQLEKIGLDGMVSCQVQRAAFPTGLPLYAMAKGLWDKRSSFNKISAEYFSAAFGERGAEVEQYMATLSALFDPPYIRREKPLNPAQIDQNCQKIRKVIADFKARCLEEQEPSSAWKILRYHAALCLKYADVLEAYAGTKTADRQRAKEALLHYAKEIERDTHFAFDPVIYQAIFRKYLDKFPEE